ncbi:hypothetical protein [Pseudonocardia phyllosphaerae]|uniref:hypothetical protein n=1 Tax=Pseudonocardia phyllosphaerae TaxID=3390502 RepID=UPI00397B0283
MTSPDSPTRMRRPALLLAGILIAGGLAVACGGDPDTPAAAPPPVETPTTIAPTTTSETPTTTASPTPTSTSAVPTTVEDVDLRGCDGFSSQSAAQAALRPGNTARLDPDADGQACEVYFSSRGGANRNGNANSGSGSDSNSNDDDSASKPDRDSGSSSGGGTRPRTGHSGHPCLAGERDGDNDGYCGEGR